MKTCKTEVDEGMEKTILDMKLTDLFRATMSNHCGNEGFIGIAPDGSRYHIVVPVDRQIARGLKFWIAPDDGTPFGGYTGWHYFACPTYEVPEHQSDEFEAQLNKARENGWLLQKWGQAMGLEIRIIENLRKP